MTFFFYGSNTCIPFLKEMGVVVKNYQLGVLKSYEFKVNVIDEFNSVEGFANVIPRKKREVKGLIVDIDEQFVDLIDEYEGYPELYFKKELEVLSKDKKINCWVYIGSPEYSSEKELRLSDIQQKRIICGQKIISRF